MIGLVFVMVALVVRAFLGAIATGASVILAPFNRVLGLLPAPWPRVIKGIVQKALLLIVWLLAFGSVGLFFRWTQGFTKVWEEFNRGEWAEATSTVLGDSVRLIVIYLQRVQDESLRFFTGRTLPDFLAESTDAGPGAFAHFFRLLAGRFHAAPWVTHTSGHASAVRVASPFPRLSRSMSRAGLTRIIDSFSRRCIAFSKLSALQPKNYR